MHTHAQTNSCTRMHALMHKKYTCTLMQKTLVYIHTQTQTHTHIHTYTHTHTHYDILHALMYACIHVSICAVINIYKTVNSNGFYYHSEID